MDGAVVGGATVAVVDGVGTVAAAGSARAAVAPTAARFPIVRTARTAATSFRPPMGAD